MRKFLGYTIIILLFAGLFVAQVYAYGLKTVLIAWLASIGIVALFIWAVSAITEDN